MNDWVVYIVECSDKSLYTGISNNVGKRLDAHNNGKGASYTRGRRPVKLLFEESIGSYPDALKREAQIKKLSKKKKLNLIKFGS